MTIWSLSFSVRVFLLVPCQNVFLCLFFFSLKNPVIEKDLRGGEVSSLFLSSQIFFSAASGNIS